MGYLEGELGIQGEDLTKVIKGFPEVIACSVEKRLKANVEHMQKVSLTKDLKFSCFINLMQLSVLTCSSLPGILHAAPRCGEDGAQETRGARIHS